MTVLSRVPTDNELKEWIAKKEEELKFLQSLLKLNDIGREKALIYMFGLLHFEKYRKDKRFSKDRKESDKNGKTSSL